MGLVLRHSVALGLATIFALSPVIAATDPGTSDLEAQITALDRIVAKDQVAAPGDERHMAALNVIRSLENSIHRKDFSNALNLTTVIAQDDPSDAASGALVTLNIALEKARDDQARASAEMLKKILADSTQAITSGKDPKDLDATLDEIAKNLDVGRKGVFGSEWQTMYAQLESADRFVKGWQSYLVDKQAGNPQMAANDLRNLTMQEGSFMPIPRSELLQRALKESGQAVSPTAFNAKIELHSFDDLPTAIAQLEALQRSGNYSMEMGNLSNALQSLHSAWLSYQDKNYTAALQQLTMNPFFGGMMNGIVRVSVAPAAGDPDSLRKEVSELKNQLMVEIVQGLLNLPDSPASQPDELASDYLLRLAAAREKAGDWTGLQQVLLVYQQAAATFGAAAWLQEDLAGLHAYLVGEKLEGAGQDLDAIRSYRQALATIGKFFPADPPAAKLNELQKKYPDLYQQALQQPITPRGP
jgi:tetratricopeptide (TPR) repeat protein